WCGKEDTWATSAGCPGRVIGAGWKPAWPSGWPGVGESRPCILTLPRPRAIGRGPTWELATAMRDLPFNKYRAAMDVLQRGHDLLVEGLAEEVLDQQESLLESQVARLHFLGLFMGHLEQSAETVEEEAMRRHQLAAPKADPTQSRKRSRNRNSRAPKPRRQPPPNSEEAVDDIPF